MISSPELRNASTLGGDLLQEVWCQYFAWRIFVAGETAGNLCYGAIGDNSYYTTRRWEGDCATSSTSTSWPLGGADNIRVGDLTGTGVNQVNIDPRWGSRPVVWATAAARIA